eukprot:tig00000079_g2789.t1
MSAAEEIYRRGARRHSSKKGTRSAQSQDLGQLSPLSASMLSVSPSWSNIVDGMSPREFRVFLDDLKRSDERHSVAANTEFAASNLLRPTGSTLGQRIGYARIQSLHEQLAQAEKERRLLATRLRRLEAVQKQQIGKHEKLYRAAQEGLRITPEVLEAEREARELRGLVSALEVRLEDLVEELGAALRAVAAGRAAAAKGGGSGRPEEEVEGAEARERQLRAEAAEAEAECDEARALCEERAGRAAAIRAMLDAGRELEAVRREAAAAEALTARGTHVRSAAAAAEEEARAAELEAAVAARDAELKLLRAERDRMEAALEAKEAEAAALQARGLELAGRRERLERELAGALEREMEALAGRVRSVKQLALSRPASAAPAPAPAPGEPLDLAPAPLDVAPPLNLAPPGSSFQLAA